MYATNASHLRLASEMVEALMTTSAPSGGRDSSAGGNCLGGGRSLGSGGFCGGNTGAARPVGSGTRTV